MFGIGCTILMGLLLGWLFCEIKNAKRIHKGFIEVKNIVKDDPIKEIKEDLHRCIELAKEIK